MDVTIAAPTHSIDGQFPAVPLPAVLFDLDGTLVDPAGGITGGIAHALRVMGLPVPGADVLEAMIGPKLADALVSVMGVPEVLVAQVIGAYREWYAETGMAMSTVYPGVRELLVELRAAGFPLAVATQKPEPLAESLLAHHGLAELLDVISGSAADETLMPGDPGYRAGKADIIAAALTALDAGPGAGRAAVMVGDRHQDVKGARANGLDCIGVSWGFAPDGELAAAGVAAVVHDAPELGRLLEQLPAQSGPALPKAVRGAL